MTSDQNLTVPKTRNSAIELLRIVAMLFIVCSHSSVHGGFPADISYFSPNNYLLDWMVLGNLGVNLYILISGYFLSCKPFRPISLCRHLTQVWFYSLLGYLISLLAGNAFSYGDLPAVLFPTLCKSYWFFTAYFVLLWLSPYLNLFLERTSRKECFRCLITMFILWCVILSVTRQDMYGSTMGQFVLFYLIGGYFRKYPDNLLALPRRRWFLALGAFFLLLSSMTVYRHSQGYVDRITVVNLFHHPLSVFTAGSAVGMFTLALYTKPFENRWINTVGSCTFGIYLFHDNPFLRSILWEKVIANHAFYHSGYLVVRMAVSIVLVFCVSCFVEWLRQKTVAKPLTRWAEAVFLAGTGLLRKLIPAKPETL